MATYFISFSSCLASQSIAFRGKKIYPGTGGWFLEAYSVMTNFHAKATNSIFKGMNLIARTWTLD